jgi:HAD superfamily hydrolase (TIGR01458 family)
VEAAMSIPIKALLFDLSGVLYEGDTVITGAVSIIEQLRTQYLLRFVTNTATSDSASIIRKLQTMGIAVNDDELFTAPIAAKNYVLEKQLRPYCLIHKAITTSFDDTDQSNPNCVVLGDARDGLNYASLNKAFQLCQQGAPLIGIGMNKYFKDEEGLKLDAGAFIHALEWASDTQAIIMGKPGKAFFDQVVASTAYSPEQCLMIGDDVIGDVKGAINAGLKAVLVKTGKFQESDIQQLPQEATMINSVLDLPEYLHQNDSSLLLTK